MAQRAVALLETVHARPGLTRAAAAQLLGIGTGAATELVARLAQRELLAEEPAPPTGSRGAMSNPLSGLYKTADGRFIQLMMLQGDRFWPEVCELIERTDLITDERFATSRDRFINRVECIAVLREAFAARTLDEWRARMPALEGAWAVVQTPAEVLSDPQVRANGYVRTVTGKDGETGYDLVANPVQFDEAPASITRAPQFAEHTDEILAEAGYPADRIAELRAAGVIRLQKTTPYKRRRSASRSRMLAWILTRPAIHIRAMLAGVAASETTSSLFAVSLMSAGGSSGAASLTGSAPESVIVVTNVMPRSVTWQLNERLAKKLDRSCGFMSPSRAVRVCSASRHSSAVAMRASLLSASDGSVPAGGYST